MSPKKRHNLTTAFGNKQLFKFLGANVFFAAIDRLENRAVNKFCRDLGETPTEAYKMITVALLSVGHWSFSGIKGFRSVENGRVEGENQVSRRKR